jgi:hypothetical protein
VGQVFRTSKCRRHGHPELTLVFRERPPVPGLERTLLSHFEEGVASGKKFLPGHIVQMGWAALRVMKRRDGTLGVEEMDVDSKTGWVESVDRSLMQAWLQKEVVASLGIEVPDFPLQVQTALVCKKLLDGGPEYGLSRSEPDDGEDSGWLIACFDDAHDHGEPANLQTAQLVTVAARLPFVTQFLALPAGMSVHVAGPDRIKASVFYGGEECIPLSGSYLAGLGS